MERCSTWIKDFLTEVQIKTKLNFLGSSACSGALWIRFHDPAGAKLGNLLSYDKLKKHFRRKITQLGMIMLYLITMVKLRTRTVCRLPFSPVGSVHDWRRKHEWNSTQFFALLIKAQKLYTFSWQHRTCARMTFEVRYSSRFYTKQHTRVCLVMVNTQRIQFRGTFCSVQPFSFTRQRSKFVQKMFQCMSTSVWRIAMQLQMIFLLHTLYVHNPKRPSLKAISEMCASGLGEL